MGKKQPRHYQQEAHDLALQHMREASQLNRVGKFVIDAAPATGKTLTMAMIAGSIASKGGKVMIISYQPVLCKQNFDESWEWGTVTSLYASKFSSKQTTGSVIVGTVGTVVNALSTDFKNTRVDALLIDECLTGDSMVETDNGFERIDSCNLNGMKIKCISEDDGSTHYHKPVRVFSNGVRSVCKIKTDDGHELRCTHNHRLYSLWGWVMAGDLVVGDVIRTSRGYSYISSIYNDGIEEVFDIEMPEHHNFFANGVLAHNCHQVPYDEDNSQFMQVINHFEDNSKRLGSKRPMQIIGMTGSPFRNIDSIIGSGFWDKTIYSIGIEKATEEGFLTPPIYGYPDEDDEALDFSGVDAKSGSWEFDEKALDEIVMSGAGKERLVRILTEVKIKTADRNQIIIFASTKRHAAEVKRVLLALGEKESMIGLVTDDTPEKERDEAIDKSKRGELRWLINVSCLTTGFDSPLIDTVLFLRPVGSLTLLVQCLGRAARLLKDWMVEKGYVKPNYLVLDYAGVFDRLGHLLDSPIINDAELARSKEKDKAIQYCPVCHEENGLKARRCRGKSASEPDGRCGHFFGKSIECPKCMTQNDVTAQVCRSCSHELIDPNRKLLNKAYTDDEMRRVVGMTLSPSKNGALKVTYELEHEPEHGHPYELFFGLHKEGSKRIFEVKFVNVHIKSWGWRPKVLGMSTAEQICMMKDAFKAPTHIAYRINDKQQFVIGRRWFGNQEEVAA